MPIKKQINDIYKKTKTDPYDLPINLEKIAQSLGARVLYTAMEDENSGMIFKDSEEYIIGINSLHHPNRQRFTLAHEIAHLCLHKDAIDGNIHVDKTFPQRLNRNTRSSRGVDLKEIEANNFAAELLMPIDVLKSKTKLITMDIEEDEVIANLAKEFEVSFQSMSIRIAKEFL